MDEIDYIGERGLGPWLRARREKKGMSVVEVAQAASMGSRTVQRYEDDQGLGYETLRMLDALGITLKPAAPRSGPLSVNGELRLLRRELEARAAEDAERHQELDRRLAALEAQVAALPTEAALRRGLDAVREAIALRASRGTRRGTGTDG